MYKVTLIVEESGHASKSKAAAAALENIMSISDNVIIEDIDCRNSAVATSCWCKIQGRTTADTTEEVTKMIRMSDSFNGSVHAEQSYPKADAEEAEAKKDRPGEVEAKC